MLPLEEHALQHEGAEPHRLDRLEDELQRDEVGQVAHDGAAGSEGPRQLEEDPEQHLQHNGAWLVAWCVAWCIAWCGRMVCASGSASHGASLCLEDSKQAAEAEARVHEEGQLLG